MPNSSEDSSAVPQRRQITDEQSPQVKGSATSTAQTGQYKGDDEVASSLFPLPDAGFGAASMSTKL
jgi:hypothetical protein